MVHLVYEAQLDECFGLFGDSGNLDTNWCTICAKRTRRSKLFLTHRMELLGDLAHLESRFGPFRDAISVGAR
jgi:hypothetical protein